MSILTMEKYVKTILEYDKDSIRRTLRSWYDYYKQEITNPTILTYFDDLYVYIDGTLKEDNYKFKLNVFISFLKRKFHTQELGKTLTSSRHFFTYSKDTNSYSCFTFTPMLKFEYNENEIVTAILYLNRFT